MDDELPQHRRVERVNLDPLGIAELREYIAALQAEIARAEQAIGQRQKQQSVADSFFRKPG